MTGQRDGQDREVQYEHEHDEPSLRQGRTDSGHRGHQGGQGDGPRRAVPQPSGGSMEQRRAGHVARDGGDSETASGDDGAPQSLIELRAERHELHAGPIPDPVTMAHYGEVDPSYPERIMRMAEKHLEVTTAATDRSSRAIAIVTVLGGLTASVLPFLLAVAAIVSALVGAPWQVVTAFIGGASLAGVAKVIEAAKGNSRTEE